MKDKRNKRPITFRLDPELDDMLRELQETRHTFYYGRRVTWLIEYALRETYGPAWDKLQRQEQLVAAD